jgi:pimeloyl-ACP methyl ester carboxylesterase
MIPRLLRKPLAIGVARVLEKAGRVITPISSRLPMGPASVQLLSHSGFMLPTHDTAAVRRAVKEFLQTPVEWYMHLAGAAAQHPRVSLRSIGVPTTFVAGRYDILASAKDMATAAERIPDAEYVVLSGSHFVQLEHPETVHEQLLDLLFRVEEH